VIFDHTRCMTAAKLALIAAILGVLAIAAAYIYGRTVCPPPDWWLTAFVPSGNYGCVR
jgi:hypothetical protein